MEFAASFFVQKELFVAGAIFFSDEWMFCKVCSNCSDIGRFVPDCRKVVSGKLIL